MDTIYTIILCFLIVLAVGDLFVGVSNDATNFLNAAIGSRVATFRTVMIVASLGVLLGATFSGGMMGIARDGVYNPSLYTFDKLMLVFFSVVVTDVLLLNFFNSFGLPTSTTVSIIFELMGASVCMAALTIVASGGSLMTIADYINNQKAFLMISAIITSVPIAFMLGILIQWITRLVFTFNYVKHSQFLLAPFGASCLCFIAYFLILKGIDGSTLASQGVKDFIHANMRLLVILLFVTCYVAFEILIRQFKINVFKVVILAGTFALAFSFAGNDLVNFVGVPLAALDSYRIFSEQSLSASELYMDALHQPAKTATVYLLASGVIMAITLWCSKKALRVVQTTINLSSSERGEREQFGSSLPGRLIVRFCIKAGETLTSAIPGPVSRYIDTRFQKIPVKKGDPILPFDAVRASINLVVSSILIAFATSLTLPLSTTYVCFMVAMGSSFADGAWDRETAVYRVSGVLTVITGWFITAFSAFTVASLVLTLCYFGGIVAVFALMGLVSYVFVKVNILTKDKNDDFITRKRMDRFAVRDLLNRTVFTNFEQLIQLTENTLKDFFANDLSALNHDLYSAVEAYDDVQKMRSEYYNMARSGSEADKDACHFYYRAFTNMKEVDRELERTVRMIHDHVANSHRIYKGKLQKDMLELIPLMRNIQSVLGGYERLGEFDSVSLNRSVQKAISKIENMQDSLIYEINEEGLSLRSSELYLSILQFVRTVIGRYNIIFLMLKELNDMCEKQLASEENEPIEPQPAAIHELEEQLMKPQTAHLVGRLFGRRSSHKDRS